MFKKYSNKVNFTQSEQAIGSVRTAYPRPIKFKTKRLCKSLRGMPINKFNMRGFLH